MHRRIPATQVSDSLKTAVCRAIVGENQLKLVTRPQRREGVLQLGIEVRNCPLFVIDGTYYRDQFAIFPGNAHWPAPFASCAGPRTSFLTQISQPSTRLSS